VTPQLQEPKRLVIKQTRRHPQKPKGNLEESKTVYSVMGVDFIEYAAVMLSTSYDPGIALRNALL
jgi:hypothetical protein